MKQKANNSPEQPFCKFEDLLTRAHAEGYEVIKSELVLYPRCPDDYAIVQVTIAMNGRSYTATGQATPDSVPEGFEGSLISLAETRALARAIRFATGESKTCGAELPSTGSSEQTASSKQKKYIQDLIRNGKISKQKSEMILPSLETMSKAEASDIIKQYTTKG